MFQGEENEDSEVCTGDYTQFRQNTKCNWGGSQIGGWRNKRELVMKGLVWANDSCS